MIFLIYLKKNRILIVGLGGSMVYNFGKHQYSEIQMTFRIIKLFPKLIFNKIVYGRFLDIFITHSPPRGIHDDIKDKVHTGFKCFLWFMRLFKPKYLIHGHIHLYDINANRVTFYSKTKVINAYNYYIFNYNIEN